MKQSSPMKSRSKATRDALILASSLILCTALTGCLVFGYTSNGGWFVWPGSITLLIVIALIIWLLRR
jgi:hypothetical protein